MARRCGGLVAAMVVLGALVGAAPASAALSLTPAFTGSASQPTYVASPAGDSHRLFIVTRPGVIRVAVDGVLQTTPFLDIHTRVSQAGEGGMLSMAFDPNYENQSSPGYGLFYVYFVRTKTGSETNPPIRIEEFSADPANAPNVATSSTGRLVLEIPHNDASNHYGGTLQFGPDRYLYLAPGDGGGGDNQFQNAQDTKVSLLGKLLRIDPHQAGAAPYSIPAGNPFAGQPLCDPPGGTTNCPEIYAYGLRNPFRWSFDSSTGDLTIADVGQSQYEEVDYVPFGTALAGDNFGWPCREGPFPHIASTDARCNSTGPFVDPVFYYSHSMPGLMSSIAITGGVVVRDPALAPIFGRYLWADYFQGVIHSLQLGTPTASGDRVETDLPTVTALVNFGEDSQHHVYVVSLDNSSVQRIVCSGDCALPTPPAGGGGGGTGGGNPPPAPVDQGTTPTTPPAQTTQKDTVAPRLRIRAARLQDVLAKRRVRLSVACDETCFARVTGSAGGRRLRGTIRKLAATHFGVFELRISPSVRRALRRRGVVTLTIRARDAAGNLRTARLTIRVKR